MYALAHEHAIGLEVNMNFKADRMFMSRRFSSSNLLTDSMDLPCLHEKNTHEIIGSELG
jgi:hypothetical protein